MSPQPMRVSALAAGIFATVCFAGPGVPASAAVLCVNPSGSGGCYSSIQAAVNAAKPLDTIYVANGRYREDVTIARPVSIVGQSDDRTIIDASGQSNGIYVDGLDNPGLRRVLVSHFRIEHANFEGVLITNAGFVTISSNDIVENDAVFAAGACPGLPAFETAEGEDCGEGVHLVGVTHSTIAGNYVAQNAGGILVSNETGATADNTITENVVSRNPFDCGITLAAHPPFGPPTGPYPITRNTISGNIVAENGLQGEGAGVGIFAVPGVGGMVTNNVVIHNTLVGNDIAGVAFHSHAPGDNLNNNSIIENYIARNGADEFDAATPGTTGINVYGVSPIRGTLILKNVIEHEQIGVAVKTDALVTAHLNSLDRTTTGVDNLGAGPVDATLNWWGCTKGPGAAGCSGVAGPTVTFTPWLPKPFTGSDEAHAGRSAFDHQHWDGSDHDHR